MRYNSIDFLRGASVIGMIFFHLNYMLEYIFEKDIIPLSDIFWLFLGPIVAITFISLSGFSFFLSSQKKSFSQIFEKSLRRSFTLALGALAITFVTYTFIPEQRISWGIIHFFALASLMILPFSSTGKYNIFIGVVVIIIGNLLNSIRIDTDVLVPLGLTSSRYFAADWYPLFPWFGYVLIGHSTAYWAKYFSLLPFLEKPHTRVVSPILTIGRHAFLVYMLHVPILYFVLWMFFSK